MLVNEEAVGFDRDVPTFIIVVEKPPAVGPGATTIHSRHRRFTPTEQYLRAMLTRKNEQHKCFAQYHSVHRCIIIIPRSV